MSQERREDLGLAPLRASLEPFGVLVAARRIRAGDEAAFPDPEGAAAPLDLSRRRASGAARIAARGLLSALGADPEAPIVRAHSGAPVWPAGFVGSLAHDEAFAAAAVGPRGAVLGLGVDIEPAEPLPADLADFVLSAAEQRETGGDRVAARLVFAAKEAVYKAIHPLDGSALEYPDIEVGLAEGAAVLRDGRRLKLVTQAGGRLVAVALLLSGARRGDD